MLRGQIVTSAELGRYSIYVVPAIHVVICLTCAQAVHLDHVRSHLVGHSFKDVPKQEELCGFLLKLGALPTDCITFPTDPGAPIVGLDVVEGFECLEDGCGHISTALRSRDAHFQRMHRQQHASGAASLASTNAIPVQKLYGFTGRRVVLKVHPNVPQPPTTSGYDKYMARVAAREQANPPTYRLSSDVKLQSHFLSLTRWGSVLEGLDVNVIRGLVASPLEEDRFYPILAGCRSYYMHVASKLPAINDLFLRWINTLKS